MPGGKPLVPLKIMSEVFSEYPVPDHLHIIVNVPAIDECKPLTAMNASFSNPSSIPCPYQSYFTSLMDSTKQHFDYVMQPINDRLSDGHGSLSQESFCASMGFAPKLLACEMIPEMAVMDQSLD